MAPTAKPTRMLNLDALRILACFMVVVMHVAPQNWSTPDAANLVFNVYDSAARSAVPLFFMVSGALFLSKKGGLSLSKLYRSNVLKLAVLYVVWMLFYALVAVLESSAFAAQDWQAAGDVFIKRILLPKYHLWFLPTMLLVYLVMPALYAIAHYDNGRYLLYSAVVFLVVSIGVHSTGLVPSLTNGIPDIFGRAACRLIGYSGYFLLGYYLSLKKFPRLKLWHLIMLLVAVIAATLVLAQFYALNVGSPLRLLLANFTVPVLLQAVLIFMIFIKLEPALQAQSPKRTGKLITTVSTASLAIYVLHPFIIDHTLDAFGGYDPLPLTPWLAVPLVALAVFVFCALFGVLLKKIPFVKNWLV